MRITCSYLGKHRVWGTPETEVLFGRAEEESPIVLDLSPDQRVSRLHGRIWEEQGVYWIEDLNSSRGTQLNGIEIKGAGKRQFKPGDSVIVGQTALTLDFGEAPGLADATNYLEQGTYLLPEKRHSESGVAIAKDIDATAVDSVPPGCAEDAAAHRLKMVYDLPFQLATKTSLDTLLPAIVDQLVEVIPTGESWALVLRDPTTNVLLLKAYRYVERTYLSETLLRRAMTDRKAFIWKRKSDQDATGSVAHSGMETGMYAPLLWQGDALGAICAGARSIDAVFTDEDIKLLVLVGQCAAMAVATHRLQEKIRREYAVKSNLLRQFSPKIAEQLLLRRPRLRFNNRRSDLAILNADIGGPGLTELTQGMDADDVVKTLNKYRDALAPVIFAHHGTMCKFSGSAILATFGTPDSAPDHYENAIQAAFEMRDVLAKLEDELQLQGAPFRDVRIGLHCGEVVQGFIGKPERNEFTVFGEAVNRAEHFCAAASPREILISKEIYERVGQFVESEQSILQTTDGKSFPAYRAVSLKQNHPD
jgi:class 3 adenylate cyclase